MSKFMCRPSVIIYLDVKPERSMERINERNRDVENGISLEYLSALYEGYEEFVADISRTIPVVRVDWNRFGAWTISRPNPRGVPPGSFLREVSWEPPLQRQSRSPFALDPEVAQRIRSRLVLVSILYTSSVMGISTPEAFPGSLRSAWWTPSATCPGSSRI